MITVAKVLQLYLLKHSSTIFFSAFSDDTQVNNQRISLKNMKNRIDSGGVPPAKLGVYMSHVLSCSCSRLITTEYSDNLHVKFERPSTVIKSGLSIYAGDNRTVKNFTKK